MNNCKSLIFKPLRNNARRDPDLLRQFTFVGVPKTELPITGIWK